MSENMNPEKELLKFVPFSSCLNTSFWFELNRVKLDDYKLNDDFKNIYGFFNHCSRNDLPPIMNFDFSSFQQDSESKIKVGVTQIKGKLKCFNTLNEFNLVDKNELLDSIGNQTKSDIISGRAIDDPDSLIKFCLITFANLKSYVFHYWFAFPAVTFPNKSYHLLKTTKFTDFFTKEQSEKVIESLKKFQESTNQVYFGIDVDKSEVLRVREALDAYNSTTKSSRIMFAYLDPNSQSNHPGWPLRNFLALLTLKCKHGADNKVRKIEVLSFRDQYQSGNRKIDNSLVYEIELAEARDDERVNTVGWERNEKNQLHPRVVNMSESMNSEKLAESAVNLNLKLMKWRVMPDIDLDVIKSFKCLLLGAGTLGCNVARCLMAWGVEHITFVDNSKVSYSNPVRQTLFQFQDSISSEFKDNYKATKAAENLKLIYPGVNSKGIKLSIPMPGHHVNDNLRSKVRDDVKELEKLIKEHDCVFLLMDTRESRWLPTVLAAAEKKLVINSALGFDSFLVMRHGVKSDKTPKSEAKSEQLLMGSDIPAHQLGCYYCNDIVAPGNSTIDRTLDQQCTVSRPGLSMIASALAVELMVSILQHPLKKMAPSSSNANNELKSSTEEESCLGMVPHQIRGYLHSYSLILPASQAFEKCTACSEQIIEMYKKDGFDFLLKVFNDSAYLEDVTGLKDLKTELDDTDADFVTELSDTDD